jgi:hypothetical protein
MIGVRISVVATIAVLAAACSGPAEKEQPAETFSGEVPAFDGPYADEFAQYYRTSTSDFVRQVLADEQITDAEYAEMTTQLSSCLADQGITLNSISPAEGMNTSLAPNGGDTHAIVDGCSTESGEDSIGALRDFMAVNPDNLDTLTITADCLVKSGTVPPGYSADDLSTDITGQFADVESLSPDLHEAFVSCTADPLGLLGTDG